MYPILKNSNDYIDKHSIYEYDIKQKPKRFVISNYREYFTAYNIPSVYDIKGLKSLRTGKKNNKLIQPENLERFINGISHYAPNDVNNSFVQSFCLIIEQQYLDRKFDVVALPLNAPPLSIKIAEAYSIKYNIPIIKQDEFLDFWEEREIIEGSKILLIESSKAYICKQYSSEKFISHYRSQSILVYIPLSSFTTYKSYRLYKAGVKRIAMRKETERKTVAMKYKQLCKELDKKLINETFKLSKNVTESFLNSTDYKKLVANIKSNVVKAMLPDLLRQHNSMNDFIKFCILEFIANCGISLGTRTLYFDMLEAALREFLNKNVKEESYYFYNFFNYKAAKLSKEYDDSYDISMLSKEDYIKIASSEIKNFGKTRPQEMSFILKGLCKLLLTIE